MRGRRVSVGNTIGSDVGFGVVVVIVVVVFLFVVVLALVAALVLGVMAGLPLVVMVVFVGAPRLCCHVGLRYAAAEASPLSRASLRAGMGFLFLRRAGLRFAGQAL